MHRKGLDWRKTLKQLAVESGVAEKLGLKLGTDTTGKATTEVDDKDAPPTPAGGGGGGS